MRHIDRERSQEIMNDIITALYHAASSEEPDTMDGPSLCDYYQRREEANPVSYTHLTLPTILRV